MIEPQPGAHIPIPQVNLILNVGGGLDIPSPRREFELRLGSRIELRRIGDGVTQSFLHRIEDAVDSDLPIVSPMMSGEVLAQVSFAVPAVLRNNDRRGLLI